MSIQKTAVDDADCGEPVLHAAAQAAREVFTLRDPGELPMPEVAERLGISTAAAKWLLRARLELRCRLERVRTKGACSATVYSISVNLKRTRVLREPAALSSNG